MTTRPSGPTPRSAEAGKAPTFFGKVAAFFGRTAPAGAPELPPGFLRRYRAELKELGLEAGPAGFTVRLTQAFAQFGLTTELVADPVTPFKAAGLAAPDLREPAAMRAHLTKIRDDLTFQARFALTQADSAIHALAEFVLRPTERRWLGPEEKAREQYLNLPPRLAAAEAATIARRIDKEAHVQAAKARMQVLEGRIKKLSTAKLNGRTLFTRYTEAMPLRSATLELELNIEKTLEHRDIEKLIDAADEAFPAVIDQVLTSSRKTLVSRVGEQLTELARSIQSLPHIELLADTDIAAVVAPYYGGLNRSLKRRRAKSALVAVEEMAREAKYQDDLTKLNERRAAYADVAAYYPLARTMKRELVLYTGPTNSGKTWRALNELAEAESGVYLAPLRLLALEGQEELEKRGKPTSFITGEERDLRPEAKFVSSTIEMLNLELPVDAVVVDEAQLLADERRGWAWLAAVVGAPAKKIIMTGSPDCVQLVRDLAAYLGEELTVHELTRHNELRVAPKPMRLRELRQGMAVVCFSRRDVLRIKTLIQDNSEHKVSVVYGNLSPQVRREEARRFRSGEADILVATDAIAMGLNLPISEVLFYTTEKFNGEEMCELTPSEIRQIGGRAGRFGFAQFGVVNALNEDDLELIREAINGSSEPLTPPFYVAPGHNHIRIIADVLGTTSLERILTFFDRAIEFSDERFARSNIDELSYLSTFVDERLPWMDTTQRLTIACAPVAIRNEAVLHWFLNRMLKLFKDPEQPVEEEDDLEDLFEAAHYFDHGAAKNQAELRDAEDYLKTLTVYAWLAYRYPAVFTRIDDCEMRREAVNSFVERSLRKKTPERGSAEAKGEGGGRGEKRRRGGGKKRGKGRR